MRFADTIGLVSSGVNINVPVCMLLKSECHTNLDTMCIVYPLDLSVYVYALNLTTFYTLTYYTLTFFHQLV